MKSMFENMKKAAADTFSDDIKMIDAKELIASADNIFSVERIEELAETILGQGGVKENLIVKPRPEGGYEIISGHRRTAAVRYLLEQGETVSRYLPCLVEEYPDEDEKRLAIVLMNVSARVISDAELWKSYEVANEVLQNKKKLGEKFGKVRDKLAEILNVSKGQVAHIEKIAHSADEEIKNAIGNGKISINEAFEKVSGKDKKGVKSNTFSEKELLAENARLQREKDALKKAEKGVKSNTFFDEDGFECETLEPFEPDDGGLSDFQNDCSADRTELSENTDGGEYDGEYGEPESDEDYGEECGDGGTVLFASEPKADNKPVRLPSGGGFASVKISAESMKLLAQTENWKKTLLDIIERTSDGDELILLRFVDEVLMKISVE